MKFKLIINKDAPEEVTVTAHQPSELTEQIESLVRNNENKDRIVAYTEDDMLIFKFSQIECITILDGKTYIIDDKGKSYQAVSIGIYSALRKVIQVFGAPTWEKPIPLEVKQITKGDRKMLTLNVAM